MRAFFLFLFVGMSWSLNLKAQAAESNPPGWPTLPAQESVWSTRDHGWLTPEQVAAKFGPGDVIVLGEEHAVDESVSAKVHHGNQWRMMQALPGRVSLGMEFFAYPCQGAVDDFLAGRLNDADFLAQVKWAGNTFEFYRPQVLLPLVSGGQTLALNIPREVSGQVSRGGASSLSAEQKALLPPLWERGSAAYFERFGEIMGGHVTPDKLENYFWAQSLWDDTMAWKVSEHRASVPDDITVVIVGGFHAQFGHGLPARLTRHGLASVKTVLQAEVTDWTEDNLRAAVADDPRYGAQADYVWVYKLP